MILSEEIEAYRDRAWRRDPERRIEDVYEAERFVEEVGFCAALTDSRRPGPSLYIAVCGRRDAHSPRNVQKDPETRLAWTLKDEVMRRGKLFYGKLLRSHSTFIAPRLLPSFVALFGMPRRSESKLLTEVLYEPTFTYIWSIPEARFQGQMKRTVTKEEALKEIAQAYLLGAGMSLRGELARV